MVSQILISNQILMIESQSRGLFFNCNGGVVSWKSSKQDVTINSITESMYIAALDAAIKSCLDEEVCFHVGSCSFR